MSDSLQVNFFGPLIDIMGKENLQCPYVENTELLKDYLCNAYPALKHCTFVLSINHEIITDKTHLQEGQTVAFLPPFSGG